MLFQYRYLKLMLSSRKIFTNKEACNHFLVLSEMSQAKHYLFGECHQFPADRHEDPPFAETDRRNDDSVGWLERCILDSLPAVVGTRKGTRGKTRGT